MLTFDYTQEPASGFAPQVHELLAQLYEDRGKMALVRESYPELLASLADGAFFDNVDASARLEGMCIQTERARALIGETAEPQGAAECQLVGYARALRTIFDDPSALPVRTSTLLALHEVLVPEAGSTRSRYRAKDYTNMLVDGSYQRVRVSPVNAFETPLYLGSACDSLSEALDGESVSALLLIPRFTVDFLCIRPFDVGCGRISRLFALLLLERLGFDIAHFASYHRLCAEDGMGYYQALNACTKGWERGVADYSPFAVYWLGTLHQAYEELFSKTLFAARRKPGKSDRIRLYFQKHTGPTSKADLVAAYPDISLSTIENALHALCEEGVIVKQGAGRSTTYQRFPRS